MSLSKWKAFNKCQLIHSPILSFIILLDSFITWSLKRSLKNMNQAISHTCTTLLNQKILNPANEALHEGCLPASLSQLVPPSCRLLQPSVAQGTPHHFKAFAKAPPSVGLLPAPFPPFVWLLSSPFPQSPSLSLKMNQAPLFSSRASCSCHVSHSLSTGSFNFCLSH